MDLVQMVRTYWFGHELPDAIIQSALGYQIGATTISGTNPFIPHRSPLSENGSSIKIDLVFCVAHRSNGSTSLIAVSIRSIARLARRN